MKSLSWLIGWIAIVLVVTTVIIHQVQPKVSVSDFQIESSDGRGNADASSAVSNGERFTTTIRRPSGPPTIELDQADPQGRVGSVACSTCHSTREANLANQKPEDLKLFHQNMPLAHGKIACYACHHKTDMDSLQLADGSKVAYTDVMTLCAQCHGVQARDYAHGAHGGMNGYWDLSRGPRTRNNCVDCHDPHAPQFPSMQPTFKPRDRFLDPPRSHSSVSSEVGNE